MGIVILLWTLVQDREPVRLALGEKVSPMRPLLGVNIGPGPVGERGNADLTEAYRAAGVREIRTHDYYGPLDMATMYPDQEADPADEGSYRFTESDVVFDRIVKGGFEPYLRLGDSWNNSPGFPAASPRKPRDADHWVRAAVHVVRHYTSGRFEKSGIRYVEIWNEPDGRFWDGTADEFAELFAKTATALQKEFPKLRIGGPGYTPAGALTDRGNRAVRKFLARLRAEKAPLDFFSWHMYANDLASYEKALRFYRSALDENGFRSTAMHVTEWHTETKRGGHGQELALRTGGRGAAILTAAWILFQEHGVEEAHLYRGPDPSPRAPEFYGIFYANGKPKRTALAFTLWASVAKLPDRLEIRGAKAGLSVLAARGSDGETAVLLANTTSEAISWSVDVDGTEIRLAEVSDASEEIREKPLASLEATMPPNSVQRVSFLAKP